MAQTKVSNYKLEVEWNWYFLDNVRKRWQYQLQEKRENLNFHPKKIPPNSYFSISSSKVTSLHLQKHFSFSFKEK